MYQTVRKWHQMKNKLIMNKNKEKYQNKKIAFVAHEFGLFRGHGGIAAYLNQICTWLVLNTNYEIYVLVAGEYQVSEELSSNQKFHIYDLRNGDICFKRNRVLHLLKEIRPDYVECTDFLALGLYYFMSPDSQKSVCITNNHTATRECWEWSTHKDLSWADFTTQNMAAQERIQIQISDYNIAPSRFLGKYVEKIYQLENPVLFFFNPFFQMIKTKEILYQEVSKVINLEPFKRTYNVCLISRFEGRKCQERLINSLITLREEKFCVNGLLAGNTSILPDTQQDYRQFVMDTIPQKFKPYIKFFDFVKGKEQDKFFAVADLVVMPSTFENCPVAMIETVLRGIPVMGSKYSGLADYCEPNMLFAPFVKNDLTNKMRTFLELSKVQQIEIWKQQHKKLQILLNPKNSILPRFNLVKPVQKTNRKILNLRRRYCD